MMKMCFLTEKGLHNIEWNWMIYGVVFQYEPNRIAKEPKSEGERAQIALRFGLFWKAFWLLSKSITV